MGKYSTTTFERYPPHLTTQTMSTTQMASWPIQRGVRITTWIPPSSRRRTWQPTVVHQKGRGDWHDTIASAQEGKSTEWSDEIGTAMGVLDKVLQENGDIENLTDNVLGQISQALSSQRPRRL